MLCFFVAKILITFIFGGVMIDDSFSFMNSIYDIRMIVSHSKLPLK